MSYLEMALKRGDEVGAWRRSEDDALDPWTPAQHHLLD